MSNDSLTAEQLAGELAGYCLSDLLRLEMTGNESFYFLGPVDKTLKAYQDRVNKLERELKHCAADYAQACKELGAAERENAELKRQVDTAMLGLAAAREMYQLKEAERLTGEPKAAPVAWRLDAAMAEPAFFAGPESPTGMLSRRQGKWTPLYERPAHETTATQPSRSMLDWFCTCGHKSHDEHIANTMPAETGRRLAARPIDQREGPDERIRCADCDQGLLDGEVFTYARECCEPGKQFDINSGVPARQSVNT